MGKVNYQDYNIYPVRSSTILTGSYVVGTVIGPEVLVEDQNQLVLYISFTIGALTSGQVKIEFSNDGTNYYQESIADLTTTFGTSIEKVLEHSYAASGNYRLPIEVKDRYIKISAKGTGADATGSLMQIDLVVGTA